jgi:hypothetical protein
MSTSTVTGIARFVGSAKGAVHDGEAVVDWTGEASLVHLEPALGGFSVVAVSTAFDVPRIRFDGSREFGFETLIFGVRGEDLQVDWSDLPGGGFNTSVAEALAQAGYALL